ncbi:MAG: TIGR03435 family protein [Vicinamibacterales bacterium]
MRAFCCALAAVVASVVAAHGERQQTAREVTPAFEVASVKTNVSRTAVLPDGRVASGTNVGFAGGRFSAQNASLRTLMSLAYDIQDFRISGGPQWMRTSRFDIEAKASTAVDERVAMLMLRSLLADRFGLSLHREAKEMPAHVLLLAKKGPRPQPTRTEFSQWRRLRYVVTPAGDENPPTRIRLVGTATMEQLAAFLGTSMRSPVVDATGLEGAFDINVAFTSDTFAMSMKGGERDAALGLPSALVPPDPELANALKTQLGLQIETQRRPIEVLVIDGAAQPSEH